MSETEMRIPRRVLGTLLNSIGSGVVPRFGLEYIAIGRKSEIGALLGDLDFIQEGGSTFRFVVGRYGSGKSFLLQLIRGHCLERGFITADADLTPERRLAGTKGQGLATYKELISNLAAKASPEGGALGTLIARWFSQLQMQLVADKGYEIGSPDMNKAMTQEILAISKSLEGMVSGFDFAVVLNAYYQAHCEGGEETKSNALRWLRGEYTSRVQARTELGVNSVIDDTNWYSFIKLFAVFVRRIGYKGLVVFVDECVNLYKIPNRISRENNYEKILSMFNDTLQGKAEGLGLIFGGTPQFLEDARRGLYSYEALRSRLADSRFIDGDAYVNFMGPIIRLERLSDDEIFALISRVGKLHAQFYSYERTATDGEILAFLKLCLSRAAADKLVTPREIIRDFLAVMGVLYQNPSATFEELLGTKEVVETLHTAGAKETGEGDDFTLEDMEF